MASSAERFLAGEIFEESTSLSVADLCRICGIDERQIEELLEEGVISVTAIETSERRFSGAAVRRTRIAVRLQRDLGINLPGAALALDLLEEIEQLRRRRPV
ncbi:MAG TPA: chaperone modulator CbpM [Steroidobacteraceae bacterium]|nr:chaperone modulator CbpM [Steroidobacteraceae bacterium]